MAAAASTDSLMLLTKEHEPQAQMVAVDAAIATGIPHLVPSSFAWGLADSRAAGQPGPVQEGARRGLRGAPGRARPPDLVHVHQHGHLPRLGPRRRRARNFGAASGAVTPLYDGGVVPFLVTTHNDIGRAVAAALGLPAAIRHNRVLHIHSAVVTQAQLLALARSLAPAGVEFATVPVDTAQLERDAWPPTRPASEAGPPCASSLRATASAGV